jgi:hypothetical protein
MDRTGMGGMPGTIKSIGLRMRPIRRRDRAATLGHGIGDAEECARWGRHERYKDGAMEDHGAPWSGLGASRF